MTQAERRIYLIKELLAEQPQYSDIEIPDSEDIQKRLLRSLMNVRMPKPISADFMKIQDEYLSEAISEKGITNIEELSPVSKGIYIWQGDITTLCCDAIVNAANSGLTGCYSPCHNCIDNCIHTFSGIQLRNECDCIMKKQGHEEPVGRAKVTGAYNLPCKYVIHTVGPTVRGRLTSEHCKMLEECYLSCLSAAVGYCMKSIAFCCISTGVFGFPKKEAAETAVRTVCNFLKKHDLKVIFNVFGDEDYEIYQKLFIRTE